MKKFVIVLLVMMVAGSAIAAERISDPNATLQISGAMENAIDNGMREALITFTDFTQPGFYFSPVDADPLEGLFSGAVGDFVLVGDGVDYTYCDDLAVLVANADLSVVLLQLGGYSTVGATYQFSWPNGASDAAGTVGGGAVDFGEDIDVTGYYLWLGNGYSSGGATTWTGSIQLLGSVVANEETTMDAIKALYR